MPDADAAVTSGVEPRGYRRGALTTDGWDQYVVPTKDRITTFQGRCAPFIVPGRAAVQQRLLGINNAAGSGILVFVQKIRVDVLILGGALAVGVLPPVIRLVRYAGLPTGGVAQAKVGLDTTQTSSASVTVTGDANADNAAAATALAFTSTGFVSQVWAPRLVQATATAANSAVYEPVDTVDFLSVDTELVLQPGQGCGILLDAATVTTGNPATNRWTTVIDWDEATRP